MESFPKSYPRPAVWVWLVLIALAALHLLLLIPAQQRFNKFIEIDSLEYYYLAEGVLDTGRYQSSEIPNSDLVRPPGYPLLLMLSIELGSLQLVQVIQTLLVFLGAVLLYHTGAQVGSKKAGFAAAVIYLLNPNAAFWALSVLTETLAGFLLTLAVWSIARYWRAHSLGWLLLAGASLSAGALTRPIILPLAFLIAILIIALELNRSRQASRTLKAAGVICVGIMLLVLPWQLRNLAVHGEFTLSKVNESTFQNWMVAKTLAQVEGISRNDAAALIAQSSSPRQRSIEIIQAYPVVFLKEQARGIARTLLAAEYVSWADKIGGESLDNAGMLSALLDRQNLSDFFQAFQAQMRNQWFWAAVFAMLYNGVLYTLCCAAVWKALRLKRHSLFLNLVVLLVMMAGYLILIPAAAGESRFRAPADPLLGLLAGLAFFKDNSAA